MIARKISDVRKFMSGFLIGNMLDNFRLAEAVITTFCTFTIDGRLERRFFGEAEETDDQPENAKNRGPADLVAWKDVRERCFDLIRGKGVDEALAILQYTPKAASPVVAKVLNSAIANAVNNQELNRQNLYVAEVYANPGPTLKRYVARSRGSASPMLKRTSHISVVLDQK